MKVAELLQAAPRVLDGLYPRVCCACGTSLTGQESNGLCWDCRSDTPPLGPPWCDHCGRVIAGRVDHTFTCVECQEEPPAYTRARSLYRYEGGVREAIHALKYHREFSVVPDLSRMLLAGIQAFLPEAMDCVLVPVPLHRRRQWHRQFNQAAELIRGIRRLEPSFMTWTGLKRVKDTETQTRLSKSARRTNVRGAFAVSTRTVVPERILLIDDVMTTGATLDAAAKAVRKAGAGDVYALTLARG